ncbi:type II secretion system F family protein, partial [Pseudomonas aeruginosa]|nr:type II secretion system F family protein [Pseudomonas aeruginosa]
SGHLDGVLNRLADYTEQRQQLRARLLQAMIYPIVLTLVGLLCVEFTLMPVTDWLLAHGWLVTPTLP